MSKATVVIRTHVDNEIVRQTISQLEDQDKYNILILCDERRGPISLSDVIRKVSVTPERFGQLDLYLPPDVMWRCGDYFLYLVSELIDSTDYIWMIEHDVVVNCTDLSDFFSYYDKTSSADFLAVGNRPAPPEWVWSRSVEHLVDTPYICLFPLTRMSWNALKFLKKARQDQSAIALSSAPQSVVNRGVTESIWPNDEAFVASMLHSNGYVIQNFNDIGQQAYTSLTFGDRHHSALTLKLEPKDNMIYHPVSTGESYRVKLHTSISRMTKEGKSRDQILDWLGPSVVRSYELECGEGSSEALLFEIQLLNEIQQDDTFKQSDAEEEVILISERIVSSSFVRFATLQNDFISGQLRVGQFYDPIGLKLVSKGFPKGGCFLDIGAHIGNYVVYGGMFLSPREIIAIEPNPRLARVLRSNIDLNRLSSLLEVSVEEVGLSDKSSPGRLFSNTVDLGASGAVPSEDNTNVMLTDGDSLVAGRQVDFIKVDTFGTEIAVLNGLRGTIKCNQMPILLNVRLGQESATNELIKKINYYIAGKYKMHWDCENWLLYSLT